MRLVSVIALALVCAASGIRAHHCTTYSTSEPEISAAELYYVDVDCPPVLSWDQPCGPMELWGYQETNGVAGLQRADATIDDTCHGLIQSDTVIF